MLGVEQTKAGAGPKFTNTNARDGDECQGRQKKKNLWGKKIHKLQTPFGYLNI